MRRERKYGKIKVDKKVKGKPEFSFWFWWDFLSVTINSGCVFRLVDFSTTPA
jgi:hypothetical protein